MPTQTAEQTLLKQTKQLLHKAIRNKCPSKCPRCQKFTEILTHWTDTKLPGVYCNSCSWQDKLPEPLPKLCAIEDILVPSLIELVRACPENQTIRTLIHQACLLPVPAMLRSFEEIKEWLEHSIEQKPAVANVSGPEIVFRLSRRVHGTCCYTETETCDTTIPEINANDLLEGMRRWAADGYTLNDFMAHQLLEMAERAIPPDEFGEMEWAGQGTETDNYDQDHGDPVTFLLRNPSEAREQLNRWLYSVDRETYNRFSNNIR